MHKDSDSAPTPENSFSFTPDQRTAMKEELRGNLGRKSEGSHIDFFYSIAGDIQKLAREAQPAIMEDNSYELERELSEIANNPEKIYLIIDTIKKQSETLGEIYQGAEDEYDRITESKPETQFLDTYNDVIEAKKQRDRAQESYQKYSKMTEVIVPMLEIIAKRMLERS